MEAAIQTEESGQGSREVADPSPIRFDENSDRFFMCRHCRNHIVSIKNVLREDFDMKAIFCKNVVNVHTFDGEVDPALDLLFHVVCNQCNSTFGRRINFQLMDISPSSMVPDGVFIFPLNKLLLWKSRKVIYADTKEPVSDTEEPITDHN